MCVGACMCILTHTTQHNTNYFQVKEWKVIGSESSDATLNYRPANEIVSKEKAGFMKRTRVTSHICCIYRLVTHLGITSHLLIKSISIYFDLNI